MAQSDIAAYRRASVFWEKQTSGLSNRVADQQDDKVV
jgi:hypothetical protein